MSFDVSLLQTRYGAHAPNPPPLSKVLDMWNSGKDTFQIARAYLVHESIIYNMLARHDQKISSERA